MRHLLFLIIFSMFATDNDCKIEFASIGLNNYNLNISSAELKSIINTLKKEPNSESDKNISIYSFVTDQEILAVNRKVKYYFAFKEDKLRAYVFNIYSGRDIKYYKSFVKEARKNNDFISERGISFLETKNNCEKFLRIKSDPNEIIIFGGISQIGSYW